jgi:hypothetical protein
MEYIMRFVKLIKSWSVFGAKKAERFPNVSACLKHARAHGVQRAEFVMFNKGTNNVYDLA